MSGTSGPSSRLPLAYYDPDTCCWRTSQTTFAWDSMSCSPTLPAWGMTRGGELFALPRPELHTAGHGCSSLLPTPTASESTGAGYTDRVNGGGRNLRTEVTLLPTPCAHDSGNTPEEHLRKKPGRTQVTSLQVIVDHGLLATGGRLLPTPLASDGEKGGPNQRDGAGDLRLSSAVHLLPTPTAMDAHASGGSVPANVTLTDAIVRTSLGARTNPRFDDGNEQPADQLLGQLSLDATDPA